MIYTLLLSQFYIHINKISLIIQQIKMLKSIVTMMNLSTNINHLKAESINNSTNINSTDINRPSLKRDGQQFHQYQQK